MSLPSTPDQRVNHMVEPRYWAFISYSHADKAWGDWLHKALEGYRLPKSLRGTQGVSGEIPKRLFPIFRDREELPSSANLAANITEALEQSRTLIVICSPRSAASRWVNEEILQFKRLGKVDRILCIIVDGEPNATDKPGREAEECFPEALKYTLGDEGKLSILRAEPIAADARPNCDGKRDAFLKVVAGILGLPFDSLRRRDQQRQKRRMLMLGSVAALLMGIMASLTVLAVLARKASDRQLGLFLYQKGLVLAQEGHSSEAVALLAEVERRHPGEWPVMDRIMTLFTQKNILIREIDLEVESPNSQVHSAAYNLDGSYILARHGSYVQVWNARTGKPQGEAIEHKKTINFAAFSPDGTCIVTASDDKTARVWDAHTGKPLTEPLLHVDSVWTAEFSPDSQRVVTASFDRTARVWDARTGKPLIGPLQHGKKVTSAAFSPDGLRIVTASEDRTARVWDARTGKPLTKPLLHGDSVWTAEFSSDGLRIVTASKDHTARIWDAHTGKPFAEPLRHKQEVNSASFSPDGIRIVTASEDNTARVWDGHTGKALTEPLEHGGPVTAANFSHDGLRIVTASEDETARVWDARTGKPLSEPVPHSNKVKSAFFSPDGTHLVTACGGNTATVWDGRVAKPLMQTLHHGDSVRSAAFSPDGLRVVTASEDNTARVWDATTGKPLTEPLAHGKWVDSASFSPDSTRIVTISGWTARVWEARTGLSIAGPFQHGRPLNSAVFGPGGKHILTFSDDNYRQVWDAGTGEFLSESFESKGIEGWHDGFSPDRTRIVQTELNNTVSIWDARTKTLLAQTNPHSDFVGSAGFSPDSLRVITASRDNTARLWDANTGKPLTDPLQHEKGVNTAAFSPNGNLLVTASKDRTARIWDLGLGLKQPPPWFLRLFESIVGQRMDARMVPIRVENPVEEIHENISKHLTSGDPNDPFVKWARYILHMDEPK